MEFISNTFFHTTATTTTTTTTTTNNNNNNFSIITCTAFTVTSNSALADNVWRCLQSHTTHSFAII
jgi:hypothetical protein